MKTGKAEKHCVDAVVTWTPGDVTVAEQKGGLVSIVSDARVPLPDAERDHRQQALDARASRAHEGHAGARSSRRGDRIKTDDGALRQAAAVSAVVYKERDAAYWYRYFKVQKENDKQGTLVELGGSSVNNLADNAQLFGFAPGSVDAFGATYTVFGNVVKAQYPDLMPSFYSVSEVTDLSYVKELYAQGPKTNADNASFAGDAKIKQVVSRKAWGHPVPDRQRHVHGRHAEAAGAAPGRSGRPPAAPWWRSTATPTRTATPRPTCPCRSSARSR